MKFTNLCLLTIFALGLIKVTTSQTNYCKKSLCNGSKHIACNNKGAFAPICAKNAKMVKMTPGRRKRILNRHNNLRNKIASGNFGVFKPAARMATMTWSAPLARLAMLNVKQCKMAHDKCRNTDIFRYAGQNLASRSTTSKRVNIGKVISESIQAWFNEYKMTTMADITTLSRSGMKKGIGHFTAMMQQNSFKVGCAMLMHRKRGKTEVYLACNYAMTNVVDKPVYVEGVRAGVNCRTGVNSNYPSLCSTKEKYNVASI